MTRETITEGYTERALAQQIRRKMLQRSHGDKKKFTRKVKHKKAIGE